MIEPDELVNRWALQDARHKLALRGPSFGTPQNHVLRCESAQANMYWYDADPYYSDLTPGGPGDFAVSISCDHIENLVVSYVEEDVTEVIGRAMKWCLEHNEELN